MNRVLHAADCLDILNDADKLPSQSVDLIYLDPPFNSNSTYNLPFKSRDRSLKPVEAFVDTWTWQPDDDERLSALAKNPKTRPLAAIVQFAREVESQRKKISLAAYLLNMAQRLFAMKRALKETGSIYLHCDPTASHYLKLMMDGIFGKKNYINEITWERTNRGHKGSQFAPRYYHTNTDILLFYSKSNSYVFHIDNVLLPYEDGYFENTYKYHDNRGAYSRSSPFNRKNASPRPNLCYEYKGFTAPWASGWTISLETLKKMDANGEIEIEDGNIYRKVRPRGGKRASNLWLFDHIGGTLGEERLGYPTQKPLALMERIIKASSNEGDTVLDPFCGCGTTAHAAEALGRKWVGIDISKFSTGLIQRRIVDNFAYLNRDDILVQGTPESVAEARALAQEDKFEFEKWVCGAMGANGMYKNPGEKGADGGVDGVVELPVIRQQGSKYESQTEYVIIQVKGGHVAPDAVKALSETVRRLGAVAGVMVCFREQLGTVENQRSKELWADAYKRYPVIQGFSIDQLLADEKPNLPPTWGFKHGGKTSAPQLL